MCVLQSLELDSGTAKTTNIRLFRITKDEKQEKNTLRIDFFRSLLADKVSVQIKKQCPDITWKGSFATLGRFDVVDFIEADDPKQVEKAAMIIRAYGHSMTETLVATPWKEFLSVL